MCGVWLAVELTAVCVVPVLLTVVSELVVGSGWVSGILAVDSGAKSGFLGTGSVGVARVHEFSLSLRRTRPVRIFVLVSSASIISASRPVSLVIRGAILVSRSSRIVCLRSNCSMVSVSSSVEASEASDVNSAIPVSSFVVWDQYPRREVHRRYNSSILIAAHHYGKKQTQMCLWRTRACLVGYRSITATVPQRFDFLVLVAARHVVVGNK